MSQLIDFNNPLIKTALPLLLKDRTTGQNIIFATDAYQDISPEFGERCQIMPEMLTSGMLRICPRVEKQFDEQRIRQRVKAEVFTPSWIVNKMNNYCDEEWFGTPAQFNREIECGWLVTDAPIHFRRGQSWKRYVNSRRVEITCGEAPYLVSRYDAVTGMLIPVQERIGILDRKLRVVNEKTKTEVEWLEWAGRAFKSVYGYEFQGDNLLIARINLLLTFCEYVQKRWQRSVSEKEILSVTNIIAWNVWQMDGLTKLLPFVKVPEGQQFDLFSDPNELRDFESSQCKTFDWVENKIVRVP